MINKVDVEGNNNSMLKNYIKKLGIGLSLFTVLSCLDKTSPISETKTGEDITEHYTDFDILHKKYNDTTYIYPKNNADIIITSRVKTDYISGTKITTRQHPNEEYDENSGLGYNAVYKIVNASE